MKPLFYLFNRASISGLILLLLGALTFQSQAQTTRYVSTTGSTPASTATSWATSTTDLQGAINASASGDQVWVAGGRYTSTANYGSFSLKNGVAVYGGFAGGERNVGDRPKVNPVSGQPSTTTLTTASRTTVLVNNGLTNTTRLDGVVITGGNPVNGSGGGIYNIFSSPILTNCVISGNYATVGGGGIYNVFRCRPRLVNCTLTANRAGAGAALINSTESQPVLTNCILWDNQEAAGTSIDGTGVTANYCLIEQGEADFTGTNNLTATASPFVSETNLALKAGSLAINAGDPASTSATSGSTDLAGNPRVVNNRIDIGAYEFQAPPPQRIRYVKQGGMGNGTSWDNASGDLQSQIDMAGAEQIWVARGIYKPGPVGNTNPELYFSIKNGVAIYGGFAGWETSLDRRPVVNPVAGHPSSTTLSADLDGDGSWSGNTNTILRSTNNDESAVLDGFVLAGSAGASMTNRGGSPTYRNLLISGSQGSAIYNEGSDVRLTDCVFRDNKARNGGAVYSYGGQPMFTNCLFSGNSATDSGGGVFNFVSSATLLNCVFSNNSAGEAGGGLANFNGNDTRLINSTFTQNKAGGYGAAVANRVTQSTGTIFSSVIGTNCIFWDNQGDKALFRSDSRETGQTYINCLIDQAETEYVSADNLIARVSPFMSVTDLRLNICAPAIDAGSTDAYSAAGGPATDLGGNPRRVGQIDMGAYEFQGSPAQPLAITQQPVSGSAVCVGSTVTATVSVSGTSPTYQWYQDNLNNPRQGQTAATLTLTNVQLSDAGSYSVVVTGACNSVTSTAFSLTVNPLPTLATVSQASPVCPGQAATIRLTGLPENAVLQVNYSINGVDQPPVSVTTSNASMGWRPADPIPFQTRPLTASDNGVALTITRLTIGSTGCSQTFNSSLSLSVNAPPTVTISPSATTVCAGQSVTLSATPDLTSYSWNSGNGEPGPTTPSISVSATGTYSVTVTNASGCSATASASVTVKPTPPAPTITTQSGQFYAGGQSSVSVPQYSGIVTLVISGCTGTLNWQGPGNTSGSSTTIPVATTATGTFVYRATCQQSGCPSAPGSATVVVQSAPLAMVTPLYDCQTRQLTLRTTGGNGQPIEYHIASVTTGWETVGSTFTVQDKHIGRPLKLRARQRSSTGGGYVEVETNFTPTACGSAREAVSEEPVATLSVVVLGNPVTGPDVSLEVRGAEGQPLRLTLTNLQGRSVSERVVEQAGAVEHQSLPLGSQPAGVLLLRVSTPTQTQTVKVLKAD